MINLTNLSLNASARASDICLENGRYSPECLNKWFCPQIAGYVVNTALALIIGYVVFTWLLWAYWRWGHDKIDWERLTASTPFIAVFLGGNPRDFETKVRIELFLRDKVEKLMLGFLVILYFFYR